MNDAEQQTQKYLVNLCKFLPVHVVKWKSLMQDADKPLKAVVNFADQLRHIEKAKIKHLDNFNDVQEKLKHHILTSLEEELNALKGCIGSLNSTNQDLKNKLTVLERSTVDLDWEDQSLLIKGSGTQPSLSRLLQSALEFQTFFANTVKKINDSYKTLDFRNEGTVQALEKSFLVNLDDQRVTYLLAITQYIDNEKAVT